MTPALNLFLSAAVGLWLAAHRSPHGKVSAAENKRRRPNFRRLVDSHLSRNSDLSFPLTTIHLQKHYWVQNAYASALSKDRTRRWGAGRRRRARGSHRCGGVNRFLHGIQDQDLTNPVSRLLFLLVVRQFVGDGVHILNLVTALPPSRPSKSAPVGIQCVESVISTIRIVWPATTLSCARISNFGNTGCCRYGALLETNFTAWPWWPFLIDPDTVDRILFIRFSEWCWRGHRNRFRGARFQEAEKES